jgi:hypothetical protein
VEQGLLQFGKKFNALAAVMAEPSIKVGDCVEFYYNWKHQPETAEQYAKWQEHRRLVSSVRFSISCSVSFGVSTVKLLFYKTLECASVAVASFVFSMPTCVLCMLFTA